MEKKPSPHQIRKPGTKKPPAARSPRSTSTQKVRKGLDNGAPKARTPRKSQEKPAQFVDKNEPKSKLVENDDKDNESYLATRAMSESARMQAMDSMDNDDESLNIGARSLSMDEFMRASNMVESNLEKLSARLERSLAVSKEEIVARLPDSPMRSISTSRVTGKAELTKKVSVSTMEHVWSVRARAEAENGEGSPQINIDDLIDENVDEMISAPRSSNRFEAEGGDLEEAKKLIKDLEEELRVTKLALSETKESKMEIERKNISLENAVKELEEAVGSSDSGILKKYNAQTAELQSAHLLIKETLQQVWDLKNAQIAAQKAAKQRPRIDL